MGVDNHKPYKTSLNNKWTANPVDKKLCVRVFGMAKHYIGAVFYEEAINGTEVDHDTCTPLQLDENYVACPIDHSEELIYILQSHENQFDTNNGIAGDDFFTVVDERKRNLCDYKSLPIIYYQESKPHTFINGAPSSSSTEPEVIITTLGKEALKHPYPETTSFAHRTPFIITTTSPGGGNDPTIVPVIFPFKGPPIICFGCFPGIEFPPKFKLTLKLPEFCIKIFFIEIGNCDKGGDDEGGDDNEDDKNDDKKNDDDKKDDKTETEEKSTSTSTSSCTTTVTATRQSVFCSVTVTSITSGSGGNARRDAQAAATNCVTSAYTTVTGCSATPAATTVTRTSTANRSYPTRLLCRPDTCGGGDGSSCSKPLDRSSSSQELTRRTADLEKRGQTVDGEWPDPEDYEGDRSKFMVAQMAEIRDWQMVGRHRGPDVNGLYEPQYVQHGAAAIVGPQFGGMVTSKYVLFGKDVASIALEKLYGCSSIIVLSQRGAFVNHIWEPQFADEDEWKFTVEDDNSELWKGLHSAGQMSRWRRVVDFARYGLTDLVGKERLGPPGTMFGDVAIPDDDDRDKKSSEDLNTRAFILTPRETPQRMVDSDDGTGIKFLPDEILIPDPINAMDGTIAYKDQVEFMKSMVSSLYGDIDVEVITYSPPLGTLQMAIDRYDRFVERGYKDAEGEEFYQEILENDRYQSEVFGPTPRGKLLLQYQPADAEDCRDQAAWRLWIEDRELGDRSDQWKASEDQTFVAPKDDESSDGEGAGSGSDGSPAKHAIKDEIGLDIRGGYTPEYVYLGEAPIVDEEMGGLMTSTYIRFGKDVGAIALEGLYGCTSIVIVSQRGAWVSHIWEDQLGNKESWALMREKLGPLRKGYHDKAPHDREYAARDYMMYGLEDMIMKPDLGPEGVLFGDVRENGDGPNQKTSQDISVRAFIVTPKERPKRWAGKDLIPDEELVFPENLAYQPQVNVLKRIISDIFGEIPVEVVGYQPSNIPYDMMKSWERRAIERKKARGGRPATKAEDQEWWDEREAEAGAWQKEFLAKGTRGKLLLQYQPADPDVCRDEAEWRLWIEDHEVGDRSDQWTPSVDQTFVWNNVPSNSKRSSNGSDYTPDTLRSRQNKVKACPAYQEERCEVSDCGGACPVILWKDVEKPTWMTKRGMPVEGDWPDPEDYPEGRRDRFLINEFQIITTWDPSPNNQDLEFFGGYDPVWVRHGQPEHVGVEMAGMTTSNHVRFDSQVAAITLGGLYGCTAVVVVSQRGAWVSHIWENQIYTPKEFTFLVNDMLPKGIAPGEPGEEWMKFGMNTMAENPDRAPEGVMFGDVKEKDDNTKDDAKSTQDIGTRAYVIAPRVRAERFRNGQLVPESEFLNDLNHNVGQIRYPSQVGKLKQIVRDSLGDIPVETLDYSPQALPNRIVEKYETLRMERVRAGRQETPEEASTRRKECRGFQENVARTSIRGKLLIQYHPAKTCNDMASWRLWWENREIGNKYDSWVPEPNQIFQNSVTVQCHDFHQLKDSLAFQRREPVIFQTVNHESEIDVSHKSHTHFHRNLAFDITAQDINFPGPGNYIDQAERGRALARRRHLLRARNTDSDPCTAPHMGEANPVDDLKSEPWPESISTISDIHGRKKCKYASKDGGPGKFSCDGVSSFDCVTHTGYDAGGGSSTSLRCGELGPNQKSYDPRVTCWFPVK
ncbi:hypothetical protein CGCSCA2_v000113 [Colletotrichum siamense]|uniref:Uncharacterized protein n=1 Tax=Colletotrichum siamense TaxID=690259 RepID=A0A9P5F4F6_COLSI|nr:hypothetical protein CGCSCA2_v000113 [Colletotrichum siamense]